jgi:hypothetical protein
MKKFIQKYGFKKQWMSDKSAYWYEKSFDTIVGKIIFNFCDDGGINTIEVEGLTQFGTQKDWVVILYTKSFKKFKKKFKELNKYFNG